VRPGVDLPQRDLRVLVKRFVDAELGEEVVLLGARRAGDPRPTTLGDLDREVAHSAGRAEHQHP
jgi:hypothetical protein